MSKDDTDLFEAVDVHLDSKMKQWNNMFGKRDQRDPFIRLIKSLHDGEIGVKIYVYNASKIKDFLKKLGFKYNESHDTMTKTFSDFRNAVKVGKEIRKELGFSDKEMEEPKKIEQNDSED